VKIIDRLLDRFRKRSAGEGEWRPAPYWLPVSGGWVTDSSWNWWQKGGSISGFQPSALVEACVSAYAQTIAMCPGDHWLLNSDGGRVRQKTTALYRVTRKPNAYQSISDFLLNATRDLYMEGNAYALALRNSRFEVQELHLMNPRLCQAMISPETGEVFYALGGNEVIDYQLKTFPLLVPARDVLHIRLHTSKYNMLLGQSPIVAAIKDIAANDAIMNQQLNFYLNAARPSTVLTTDMTLDAAQVTELRARWDEQVKGLNAGGTPILTAGLKPSAIGMNAVDAQLADVMKLTEQHIALAFRIPLQILGIAPSAPLGSTEVLMQTWIASGLGFALNHIEEAFGGLFGLKGFPDEYLEFNTDALLRSLMKDRIEAFARAVQGGIYSPNEARSEFGLKKVDFGDEPRVQQQVVPLSAASQIPNASPAAPGAPSAGPSDSPAAPADAKELDHVNARKLIQNFRARRLITNGVDRSVHREAS